MRKSLVALLAMAMVLMAMPVGGAMATSHLSRGCTFLDGHSVFATRWGVGASFAAGETVTVMTDSSSGTIFLTAEGVTQTDDSPPYVLSHTFSVSGGLTIDLETDGGPTTWDVSCSPEPSPGFDECTKGPEPNTVTEFAGKVEVVGNNLGNNITVVPDGADLIVTVETPIDSTTETTTLAGAADKKVDIVACEGDDSVDITALSVNGNKVDTGEGNDIIDGSSGKDIIRAGDGDDQIEGNAGDDNIDGGGGDDEVYGHDFSNPSAPSGNDTLKGGKGDDEIRGGDGNDKLSGGPGDDDLQGNEGDDTLLGQGGNDDLAGNSGFDKYNCGGGKMDDALGTEAGEPVKKCESVF